jgi:hypothetical protein
MKKFIVTILVFSICVIGTYSQTIIESVDKGDLKRVRNYFDVLGGDPSPKLLQEAILMAPTNIKNNGMQLVDYLWDKCATDGDVAPYIKELSDIAIGNYAVLAIDGYKYVPFSPLFVDIYIHIAKKSNNFIDAEIPVLLGDGSSVTLNPLEYMALDKPPEAYNVNCSRIIAYLSTEYPDLNFRNTIPAKDYMDRDSTVNEEAFQSEVRLAFYSTRYNLDEMKALLKNGVDANLAISTAIIAGNMDAVKFYTEALGMMTKNIVAFVVKSPASISPEMKKYLTKYMPPAKK